MSKNKLVDILILVCAYLFCACFPFKLFIYDEIAEWLIPTLQLAMQLLFLAFWAIFVPRSNLKAVKVKTNLKSYLCLIPTFFVFGSNFLYVMFYPGDFSPNFQPSFAIKFVLAFIIVANEEYLFRLLLIGNLDKVEKPILKVIIAAGIFGLCHISSFLSSFNPFDLIQIVYTFGLGILLGMIYTFGGAPCTCIGVHLLFNVVNGLVFSTCYVVPAEHQITFILVNVAVAAVYAIYLSIIYMMRLRKCNVYNVRGEVL